MLDDIFGYKNFQNELIWCYRSQGFNRKKFSEKHDTILVYSKSSNFYFNLEDSREKEISESTQKRFGKEIAETGKIPTRKNGKMYYNSPYSAPRDWFIINTLPQAHPERNGYSTQKPIELMNKLLIAFSKEFDLVADFYCGSGSFLEAAMKLNRFYIGIDINNNAIELCKQRLK